MPLKIATFNVNGVQRRLPRLVEWLTETSPGVLCLQEIKTTDEKCPTEALAKLGYRSIWHGQRSHHGVAVLSRDDDLREIRRGLPGDASDFQARYLEVETYGLTVASIYLPNGNPQPGPKFDYKLAWCERLIDHAQSMCGSKNPAVLAGDLNVVPTDRDIYNARAWREDAVMQPETREAYRRLLAQGWIDCHRHLQPDARIYTFWVNAGYFRRNAGFRMDFVLINPVLATQLEEAGVDREHRGLEGASDHAPAWITLR